FYPFWSLKIHPYKLQYVQNLETTIWTKAGARFQLDFKILMLIMYKVLHGLAPLRLSRQLISHFELTYTPQAIGISSLKPQNIGILSPRISGILFLEALLNIVLTQTRLQ
ncbi:hypothetical protein Z043_103768, partial [Scleropages formosus]